MASKSSARRCLKLAARFEALSGRERCGISKQLLRGLVSAIPRTHHRLLAAAYHGHLRRSDTVGETGAGRTSAAARRQARMKNSAKSRIGGYFDTRKGWHLKTRGNAWRQERKYRSAAVALDIIGDISVEECDI